MVLLQVWNYSKEITIIFCTEFVDAGGMMPRNVHQPGVFAANLLILLVFLSWSRIFFSISASVRVSRKGDQMSASPWSLNAFSTAGIWFSEKT